MFQHDASRQTDLETKEIGRGMRASEEKRSISRPPPTNYLGTGPPDMQASAMIVTVLPGAAVVLNSSLMGADRHLRLRFGLRRLDWRNGHRQRLIDYSGAGRERRIAASGDGQAGLLGQGGEAEDSE